MNSERPRQFAARAYRLYDGGAWFGRLLQTLRPFICPFGTLVDRVPVGARVLDVGCGAGLFLAMLADSGRIREGRGFDASRSAIGLAKVMTGNLNSGTPVSVEYRDATAEWPDRLFDVVSMIDVMHHVAPASQAQVIRAAAARLAPGGILIYKDMVEHPRWRAWANRLHDLVLAHQWIHYAPLSLYAHGQKRQGWSSSKAAVRTCFGTVTNGWYFAAHRRCAIVGWMTVSDRSDARLCTGSIFYWRWWRMQAPT